MLQVCGASLFEEEGGWGHFWGGEGCSSAAACAACVKSGQHDSAEAVTIKGNDGWIMEGRNPGAPSSPYPSRLDNAGG
jgi:hypothetical protein